ncbi:hypothetical protein GA0115257_10878 [Streptomyces sp. LcepLS]|nr:hypothetical protein GA0115257_10878 [Streptomyces sp. LcepLS]
MSERGSPGISGEPCSGVKRVALGLRGDEGKIDLHVGGKGTVLLIGRALESEQAIGEGD